MSRRRGQIRHGFHVRRVRLFWTLFSLVVTIYALGTGKYGGAVVMGLLTCYWISEFVRMHRAIVKIKANPLYYLMLVQDEFGGAR